MDSPNSLSHITTPKNTHNSHEIHFDAAIDEDENDTVVGIDSDELGNVVDEHGGQANNNNAAVIDDSLDGEDAPAINRSPMEFQFANFIALANRVIDKGDEESIHALNDLHRRWTAKYGEGDRNSQELLFRRLVRLMAEQAAEHPPYLAPLLQISENRAAVGLNLRISVEVLAARDEAAMVAQPITPSPDQIQNIRESKMMMMEVSFVENASRLGVVCWPKTTWISSPIPAMNTTATVQMVPATGRAEIAKVVVAAASAVKTAVVTAHPPMMLETAYCRRCFC
ncbi:UNVERIFIED_CONTAM: hypothetical protein Sindi_0541400 [Sesamum indicum]